MATAFQRGRDGCVHAHFEAKEISLLVVLAEQLSEIVGPERKPTAAADDFESIIAGLAVEVTRPTGDPVYDRLFPRVHAEDADIADEFDRAALESLRSGRAARTAAFLQQVRMSDGEVVLSAEEAHAWLTVLTDVRLMIGTSIGIREDDPRRAEESADVAEHEALYLSVYDWLSWLQESLVACFLRP